MIVVFQLLAARERQTIEEVEAEAWNWVRSFR
jgi:hypothetical protein